MVLELDSADVAIFTQTNIAIWVLTASSGIFLAVRLWCRYRFSKLWWDDALLAWSWVVLLIAGALLSATINAGYTTEAEKFRFYKFQNAEASATTLAIAWSKVAFAITLSRIVRNRFLKYFLWFVMITANLILIPGMISIWSPACTDPRRVYRSAYPYCLELKHLEYLGGATIVYGGVIDVLLALFPWFIIRGLLLDTREKIGLTVAMSLGAITGTIVIFRAFFQLKKTDNNFNFMIFMSIFNFLEPAVTIIAQAIPMFRVLVVNVKKNSNAVRISSPTQGHHSNIHSQQMRSWNAKAMGVDPRREPDEELLHVRVDRTIQVSTTLASAEALSAASDSGDDKLYDGTLRQHRSIN